MEPGTTIDARSADFLSSRRRVYCVATSVHLLCQARCQHVRLFTLLLLQARKAPNREPLASWYSFEDPGPLPPMPTPTDPQGSPRQAPTNGPKLSQPATSKQPEKQPSLDPWAAPVEPSAEVKATESEVMAASFAGLEGDAWGGNTFGQERGQPKAEAEPIGLAKGKAMAGEEPMGKAADSATMGGPTGGGAASPQNMSSNATQGEPCCYRLLHARLADNLVVWNKLAQAWWYCARPFRDLCIQHFKSVVYALCPSVFALHTETQNQVRTCLVGT